MNEYQPNVRPTMSPKKCLMCVLIPAAALFAASTETQSDEFYSAIRANDLPKLGAMLKQGASGNLKDNHDVTPLMYAAAAGSVEAMELLIDKGAGFNVGNNYESTEVTWACPELKEIKRLLHRG